MSDFLKVDTRNKKPKVWNIAVLTAVLAVLSAVLFPTGMPRNIEITIVLFDVYYALVIVLLIAAFFKQIQYNPYSYNTIYYSGFALFFLSVLLTHIVLTVRIFRAPEVYGAQEMGVLEHIAGTLLISIT